MLYNITNAEQARLCPYVDYHLCNYTIPIFPNGRCPVGQVETFADYIGRSGVHHRWVLAIFD